MTVMPSIRQLEGTDVLIVARRLACTPPDCASVTAPARESRADKSWMAERQVRDDAWLVRRRAGGARAKAAKTPAAAMARPNQVMA